jgi:glycosyltransferase involved in cell wall biosynthesis
VLPREQRRIGIGVVTPTLNAERFLEQTLRSIWNQESDRIRIDHVLVDAGSTDRTLQIASRFPSRILVPTDDGGMYDAVNRGIAVVQGDLVGYINADDEIAPDGLGIIVDAFAAHEDAGWLCGRVEYIDDAGRSLGRMMPVRPARRSFAGIGWSCIPQQTVWVRRSFYDRVGPFDAAYRNCGDYDWYARALRIERPLVLHETLGRFRLHGSQLSHDVDAMVRESRMVQDRNGGRAPLARVSGKLLSLRLNLRNPGWFIAKKTGRIRWTAEPARSRGEDLTIRGGPP